MIGVLLQSESPWQRNDAITFFIYLNKNLSSGFLKNAKFVGVYQITCKNCNKSSWMQVNKILLTLDRPEKFPFCTQFSVESNDYEMKPRFQSLSSSLKIS